jgi:hypothetical protein
MRLLGASILFLLPLVVSDAAQVTLDEPFRPQGARRAQVAVVGGTPSQRAVLREVVSGLPETRISRVRIGPPGWAGQRFPRGAIGLFFEPASSDEVRLKWEQQVVAATFRDRSAALGLSAAVIAEGAFGGDRIVDEESRARRRLPSRREVAALQADLEGAASLGRADLDVDFLIPNGIAAVIRLHVPDPARFLKYRLLRFLDAVPLDAYEGTLIEVRDDAGPFWVWARADHGRSHISGVRRPELVACDPLHLGSGGPPGRPAPPPCPA